jgi:undecaprenyl-diphosphatase
MPLYQAIVLAIVQGLTEFLPVSSTAHLWLVPWIFNWKDPGLTFDVALHSGTLAAVLLYFWRYWVEMVKMVMGVSDGSAVKTGSIPLLGENRKLYWFLIIATIPGGIAGLLFERAADEEWRSPLIVGVALIVVALVMWAGERVGRHDVSLGQIGLVDSIIVGAAQACAILPGVSRSGSTMAAGLFRGMTRETAARFSFLLATPLVAGACLKKGLEIHHRGLPADMRLPFVVGIIISGLVGYGVIAILIRYLERRTFTIFVVYRVILGVVLLAIGWGLRH